MTRFSTAARLIASATLVLLAGCGAGIYPYSLDPKPPVPAPQITLTPTALTFSAVTGQTSAAQSITVGNSGNATLHLASITLVDTTNYVITGNNCVLTLAPGATCTLSIAFSPQTVATLVSAVTFVDDTNNVANSIQSVALSGTGTGVPMPIATLTPATLTFPDTPTGTTAASQTLTLTNTGTGPLLLSGSSITGVSFALDTAHSTCNSLSQLAAAASCTYLVTFTPQTTGAQTGSFTVTDNDHNVPGSTQSSSFTGNGTAPMPIITISPTSLDFGTTTAVGGTSASQTVTIGNSGNATLTLSGVTLNVRNPDYQLINNCPGTLAAGGTCTLVVTFTPTSAGSIPASITLTDNDHNIANSTQTISLTGSAPVPPAPMAILTPVSQTFPDTAASSTSSVQTVVLSNPGTLQLTITNITYSGTGFNETTTCPTSGILPVGSTCQFSVTFAPTATGAFSGSITVTDNAGGIAGSTQTATFTGNGTPNTSSTLVLTPSTPVQFPSTPAGSTSAAQAFTLSNNGGATATGLTIATTGGTSATAFKISSTTCGNTLAGGANCGINVTFAPTVAGTYEAFLTASDTNTPPATVSTELDAVAVAPCSGNLFSPASLSFPTTKVGVTSNTLMSTLTNCGTAPLVISSIVLGGTNPTNFTETNNCPASVAAGATCTISATFTPAAVATYSASVIVTDNGGSSPQTLPLTGTGTNSTITYQLYQFPDPDFYTHVSTGALTALYALINSAQTTIDMTMYEMQDNTFTADLVAACQRGVKVRVLFSPGEVSASQANYNTLNSSGSNCAAEAANTAFENTHQKTVTVDGATTAVMSLNLQTKYYPTTRDYMMIYNDPNDIAAIEATFAMDWAAGKPNGGTQGPSDFSYQPGAGTDLIWSPTTAQAAMTNIIANAQHDLTIENEELSSSASYIINALVTACKKGVQIHFTIVNDSSYAAGFQTLKSAGCDPHVYPDTSSGFYVHAKAVVADYGLSTQSVYMGSINYSNASMNNNRELGMYVTDPASITQLYTTMTADYNGGTAY